MEWQPISTAPKESTIRFLGWDGESIETTWIGWHEDDAPVYVYDDWYSWEPTHWMPLPNPPESEK